MEKRNLTCENADPQSQMIFIDALDVHKPKLLDSNEILVAGVLVDPINRVLLSAHLREVARSYLKRLSTSETLLHSPKKAKEANVDDDFKAYLASMVMAGPGTENEDQNIIDIDSALIMFQSSLSSQAPVIKETAQVSIL